MAEKVLLVEPEFPYPNKSKNQANGIHKNFVPVGLLKIGAYYKHLGAKVRLVRGNQSKRELRYYKPSEILITSLFTYWSNYVWDSVEHYRALFPEAKITVGGIYVTLHHESEEFKKQMKRYKVRAHVGLHKRAEKHYPDYSLLGGGVDHHVTHGMRGCPRKCRFCGVWQIEPVRQDKTPEEIVTELKAVGKNRVIFFDNNFLANKKIEGFLSELVAIKVNGKPVIFECQSGFDGRLIEKDPGLAVLLKKAHFQNVRIAWDNSPSDYIAIKRQVRHLVKAGYRAKDVSVFMIYNFDIIYKEMMRKLECCKKLGVEIVDCRYRPLEAVCDNYAPQKYRSGQTEDDYYIHTIAGWTDKKIRRFRRKVRQHNIWVRYAKDKGLAYDNRMEKWSAIHSTFKYYHMGRPPQLDIIEKSETWQRRLRIMNRVKTYCKKHNLNSLDFSGLTKKKLDKTLGLLLKKVDSSN